MLDDAGEANSAYVEQVSQNGAPAAPIPPAGGSALNDITSRIDSDVLFGNVSPADGAAEWVAQMEQALASA
ncbi:hypothetical protein [Streptomyces sp. B6B3]|uniref:hypothetical protein n=1 Tax=Streptomyces sp. B6B3 TaxID=3153570 RepID=UPI00325E48AD